MSTIPEVLTAVHCDMSVFAFSLITNKCVLDEDEEGPNHEEVIEAANENKESLSSFVTRFVVIRSWRDDQSFRVPFQNGPRHLGGFTQQRHSGHSRQWQRKQARMRFLYIKYESDRKMSRTFKTPTQRFYVLK